MVEKVGSLDLFEEGWFEALKADESTTRVIHPARWCIMPTYVCYDCAFPCTLIVDDDDAPVPIGCPWGYERAGWTKSESPIYFKLQDIL